MLRFLLVLSYLYVYKNPTVSADGDHPWCYVDEKCAPAKWDGTCKSGRSQSPVDIIPRNTVELKPLAGLKINADYFAIHPAFFIKNNGHTIQVQYNEELTSTMLLEGAGLHGVYKFSQLHFHWGSRDAIGSEHSILGNSYPMEVHFVHYSDRYENILEAVSDQNSRALAVFGIFFELGPVDNPNLKPIIAALDPVLNYHPDPILMNNGGLNFSAFFPDVLEIYRYQGSLTTPSCGEKVTWTVFRKPIPISKKQLEAFRKVKDEYNHPMVDNFRPAMPLIGRIVNNGTLTISELIMPKINEIDTDDHPNNNDSVEKYYRVGDSTPSSKNNESAQTRIKNNCPEIGVSRVVTSSLLLISCYFIVS